MTLVPPIRCNSAYRLRYGNPLMFSLEDLRISVATALTVYGIETRQFDRT